MRSRFLPGFAHVLPLRGLAPLHPGTVASTRARLPAWQTLRDTPPLLAAPAARHSTIPALRRRSTDRASARPTKAAVRLPGDWRAATVPSLLAPSFAQYLANCPACRNSERAKLPRNLSSIAASAQHPAPKRDSSLRSE